MRRLLILGLMAALASCSSNSTKDPCDSTVPVPTPVSTVQPTDSPLPGNGPVTRESGVFPVGRSVPPGQPPGACAAVR